MNSSLMGDPVFLALGLGVLACLAGLAWLGMQWRRSLQHVHHSLGQATREIGRLEAALACAQDGLSSLGHELEQLTSRQERIVSQGGQDSFRQAIALCRHGANVRQLIESCGLSEGEAHLVHSLYARDVATAAENDLH
ncbi:MAG: DUF2802 domain-containing protein [Chromatiales bacterium]|nr:DUF2802 domain-containing protein [Chromatiales bacterium]